jgi:predicted Zn-dependent peptidase
MTDMVFAPSFAEVDQEREVVLEEIAMYEDTPQELVHDLFSEAVFGDHPLGRPVIGTADVISSVSRRALAAYHRTAYAPGNVVVASAGNIEHDRLVALLQRSERRAGAPARAGTRVRRPLAHLPGPGLRFQRKETEQYHLCLGATGISRSDRRRFASSLLDSILGGSASSRLFQEIREKRGMAYAVYSFAAQYTDTGVMGIYVGTREENLAACVEICVEQIAEIAAGRLRKGELERAKENLKGRIVLSLESTSNRMSRLGKSLVTDTELLTLERVIAEIDAVHTDELAELAEVLLPAERLAAAGVGPDEARFRSAVGRASATLVEQAAA